ncbi:MAG: AraC family transcriptional regulator [Eubacteriales bacterium]|nr:AraC family transcriptional regulator [Eubacteriales bacterium]
MDSPGIYRQQQFEQQPLSLPLATFHSLLSTGTNRLYPHWHARVEVFYVRRGYGQMQIDLDDYEIGPGDIVVVSPRRLHGGWGMYGTLCSCEVAVFDLELLRGPFTDNICLKYTDPLLQQSGVFQPVIKAQQPGAQQIRACIDELIVLNETRPLAYELRAKAAALSLCAELFTGGYYSTRPCAAPSRELSSLKNTLSYINEHLSDPLSIDTLCETAQYSKYHFLRTFKRHMGLTTTEYITLMRLERAARLLRTSTLSVTDICAQVGFGNVSYFIKRFSQHYGCTPLAFRKKEPDGTD